MKLKIIQIVFLGILIIISTSCNVQYKGLKRNSREVLNTALKEYDSAYLIRETYYNSETLKPIDMLNPYYRIYSYDIMKKNSVDKKNNIPYSVFMKDVDGVISKNELDEIKERRKKWYISEWKEEDIKNRDIKLINGTQKKTAKSNRPILRYSEPLFTKDKKKAIIYESYSKNNTGSHGIKILVKKDGKWNLVGAIPIGTSG